MNLRSGIYVGRVRHRRLSPVPHELGLPLFMMYLDLAEIPAVFERRWLWSASRPAVARFKRADYLGDSNVPLVQAVRERVESATGRRPAGPIRMLTHLRYFGYCFNPVTFYYCFNAAGERPEFIIAEITNTPWKERHAYILECAQGEADGRGVQRFTFAKDFHVSPFMPMDVGYDWSFSVPGERLFIHMNLTDRRNSTKAGDEAGGRAEAPSKVFDATLQLERREITGANLAGVLLRYPWMTARVIASIHWHALRLWLKGCPVHPHPSGPTPRSGELPA